MGFQYSCRERVLIMDKIGSKCFWIIYRTSKVLGIAKFDRQLKK